MELTLRHEAIGEAIQSLEIYISMHLGQYDQINNMYRFNSGKDNYDRVIAGEKSRKLIFQEIRDALIPDLMGYSLISANRGIFNDTTDPKARDAYDVVQVIHHTLAWFRNPEGGHTLSFDSPLFSGRYKHPEGKMSRDDEGEEITLSLCREQLEIMIEAAEVYLHLQRGEIGRAFSFFTDSQAILRKAGCLDEEILGLVEPNAIERCITLLNTLTTVLEDVRVKQEEEKCGN